MIYLLTNRDGRRWVKAMLPKVRDVREAVQTVGYNLGYRHQPPRYARFNYMEKAEYWALVWGTIVMAITGILLWAHDAVLAYLPHALAVLEVTTAVHFYEAILATFSILIWHFYFVIFDPDVYPLKWTVLTGRAPEHEVRGRRGRTRAATPSCTGNRPAPSSRGKRIAGICGIGPSDHRAIDPLVIGNWNFSFSLLSLVTGHSSLLLCAKVRK